MQPGACVQSIQAIRDFRAALVTFGAEARGAMIDLDLEVRRALEWLLQRQPAYWAHEARRADEAVNEARGELHRARMVTLPGGGTPSCMVEKKALERQQRRLSHAQEKLEIVRGWSHIEEREVADFSSRASQLSTYVEGTLPKALALLDRAIADLEAYLAAGSAEAAAVRPTQSMRRAAPETSAPAVPEPQPAAEQGSNLQPEAAP